METIRIDAEKCIGCALCVKDCVSNHLEIKDHKAVIKSGGCIKCGHCYAICPQKAIEMIGYDDSDCKEVISFEEINAETLLQAMKSRRTIRQFLDKKVEEEKLEKILEAGRYAPTAANSQSVSFTILSGKQNEIEESCVKLFSNAVKIGSKISNYLKNINIDENYFFKGAPLVIVVSSKSDVDGALASSYMEMMANSLGLGVLYSGFFVACTKISGKILKMLKIPKGNKVVTCMVIGYPAVNYKRQAPRKSIRKKEL